MAATAKKGQNVYAPSRVYSYSRAATAEMAKTLLENSINIPPTMYLNQGDVIGLVTGADIDFSDVYRLRMR